MRAPILLLCVLSSLPVACSRSEPNGTPPPSATGAARRVELLAEKLAVFAVLPPTFVSRTNPITDAKVTLVPLGRNLALGSWVV